jgi:acetyltransferase-like isoleucine patch superfamily enzyme
VVTLASNVRLTLFIKFLDFTGVFRLLSGSQAIIINDCWLGSGVKVLDGVTIGKGSVIGAGSVVTKDIPELSVAVGVPARVIKKRDGKELMKTGQSPIVPLL